MLFLNAAGLYLKLARRYQRAQTTGETIERMMTWADYDDLGGVTQALTRRADEVYSTLVSRDPAYDRTIRQVMLRLVTVGGELARRQVPESELYYPEPENSRVREVIAQFSAARLLVSGTNADNVPYIEPAHDALVRGWEKLLIWKTEAEKNLILQRRLTPAAMEWEAIRSQHQTQPKGFFENAAPVGNWIDRQLFRVESAINQIPTQWLHCLRRSSRQSTQKEKPVQFLWDSIALRALVQSSCFLSSNSQYGISTGVGWELQL